MTNIIDKTTKVNLGILGSLLLVAATAAFYLGGIKHTVESVDMSMQSMKAALDRNTSTLAQAATLDAVLQARILELERRIVELERDK